MNRRVTEEKTMDDEKQGGKRMVLDNDGLHKRGSIWYFSLRVVGKRRFFSTKTRNYQTARKVRAERSDLRLKPRCALPQCVDDVFVRR